MSAITPQTVLEHYTEELKIPKGFAIPALASNYDKKSTFWNVAAKVTVVAYYSILAATILFVAGISDSTYFNIFITCALPCINPISQYYDQFQKNSELAAERAEQLKTTARHYQQLENEIAGRQSLTEIEALQSIVSKFLPGFQQGLALEHIPGMKENPENLKILKPAIAYYRSWKERIENLNQKKQSLIQTAQKLSSDESFISGEKASLLRREALEVDRKILESKVKCAFVMTIIVRPDSTAQLDEIGDFSNSSHEMRAIANAAGDKSLNPFFKFKNKKIAALDADFVKRYEVKTLARRLLEAST